MTSIIESLYIELKNQGKVNTGLTSRWWIKELAVLPYGPKFQSLSSPQSWNLKFKAQIRESVFWSFQAPKSIKMTFYYEQWSLCGWWLRNYVNSDSLVVKGVRENELFSKYKENHNFLPYLPCLPFHRLLLFLEG